MKPLRTRRRQTSHVCQRFATPPFWARNATATVINAGGCAASGASPALFVYPIQRPGHPR